MRDGVVVSDKPYELGAVGEMRVKYGLSAANRPVIRLDPENVPENLRHLVPYAEYWGVGDDLIRDDVIRTAPAEMREDLKRIMQAHDVLLNEWLAGPESYSQSPSAEYLAFSNMRMAADAM